MYTFFTNKFDINVSMLTMGFADKPEVDVNNLLCTQTYLKSYQEIYANTIIFRDSASDSDSDIASENDTVLLFYVTVSDRGQSRVSCFCV